MDSVANLSGEERQGLFSETAAQKKITPAVVEKDFWVTWTLGKIFANQELSSLLKFKGGTTLSKVYGLIERFSEDIDLILNWEVLTGENPLAERSKKKQAKLNDEIRVKGQGFIRNELLRKLSDAVSPICQCVVDPEAPNLLVRYPKAFPDRYVRPEILLEVGPLASWLPFEEHVIRSYAAEVFPRVFSNPECTVQAIKAERTFWEKATILHHEANRPQDSPQPTRLSRHYYDMYKMARAAVKDQALDQIVILEQVVEFKQKFYPRGWARYELAKPGTLQLIPEGNVLKSTRDDYGAMREMIYGVYPEFDEVLAVLMALETEINAL